MKNFLLMDLERSLSTGRLFFWKGNKHGYTTEAKEAGVFDWIKANEICSADKDLRTVLIPVEVVQRILKDYDI